MILRRPATPTLQTVCDTESYGAEEMVDYLFTTGAGRGARAQTVQGLARG